MVFLTLWMGFFNIQAHPQKFLKRHIPFLPPYGLSDDVIPFVAQCSTDIDLTR